MNVSASLNSEGIPRSAKSPEMTIMSGRTSSSSRNLARLVTSRFASEFFDESRAKVCLSPN